MYSCMQSECKSLCDITCFDSHNLILSLVLYVLCSTVVGILFISDKMASVISDI